MINISLSSKSTFPLMVVGPMAMLAVEGVENSSMVLLAMLEFGGGRLQRNIGLH